MLPIDSQRDLECQRIAGTLFNATHDSRSMEWRISDSRTNTTETTIQPF